MGEPKIAELPRRGVVAVSGEDAVKFLNDLITTDLPEADGRAAYGALLTPQGKILFDFLVFRDRGRFLFDLPRAQVADFIKRLGFYKLRARVDVADLGDDHIAVAAWGSDTPPILDGPVAPDPRLPALGFRAIVPAGADMAPDFAEATEADYDAHRIGLAVPEGGLDFGFGEAFPHDAALDQLAGVDFRKGCFVGQEVVSRMEHRGTARRRFVIAAAAASLPGPGTPVTAAGKPIGTLGTAAGQVGLALVRIDRVGAALRDGAPIAGGGVTLTLRLPPWAKFTWPDTVGDEP